MPKRLVEYKHIVEITYEEWVEAESDEAAINIVKEDPQFTREIEEQGIEINDHKVIEVEE